MSFALKFTERGSVNLNRLDVWLQEEKLDELDRAAANPPAPNRRLAGAAIQDFVREKDGQRYYVFITIIPDAKRRQIRVMEIGLHVEPME